MCESTNAPLSGISKLTNKQANKHKTKFMSLEKERIRKMLLSSLIYLKVLTRGFLNEYKIKPTS